MRTLMCVAVMALLVSAAFAQQVGPFGSPPGTPTQALTTAPAPAQGTTLTWVVIPLYHASAQLVGYAVRADDEIWDEPMSYGYGSGGRGSSGYGQSGRSSGYSGRGEY